MFTKFFFLFLCTSTVFANKNETKFLLSISRGLLGLYCEISSLELLEPNFGLSIPNDIDGEAAIDVTITNSTIPHFSKVFCELFPNINWLIANSVKIEILEGDAFYPCQKLRFLYLNDNNIKYLPTNLFSNSNGLLRLKMMRNQLKSDSLASISKLTNLLELDLSGNELDEFPIEEMKKLTNLHELYLQSNYLTDIDERRIIEYFPNLMWIYLADNDFMCSRLERIVDDLKRHGKMLEIENTTPFRKRNGVKLLNYRGIHCISDVDNPNVMLKNVTCKDFKEVMTEMQTLKHDLKKFMKQIRSEISQIKYGNNEFDKNVELENYEATTETSIEIDVKNDIDLNIEGSGI